MIMKAASRGKKVARYHAEWIRRTNRVGSGWGLTVERPNLMWSGVEPKRAEPVGKHFK